MNLHGFRKSIEKIGETLEPDEDWMPTLIIEKGRKYIIIGLVGDCMRDQGAKDMTAAFMIKVISESGCDAACLISTAWQLSLSLKDHDILKPGPIRPSTDPRRVEIVMCCCVGRTGESDGEQMMTGAIERSKGHHPKIRKWETMDSKAIFKGRFFEAMKEGFKTKIEEGEEWKTL
jgi:hypothetical protein